MHCVCEQCQAAGDEPAHDLGDRVESRDRECERECAATAGPRVGRDRDSRTRSTRSARLSRRGLFGELFIPRRRIPARRHHPAVRAKLLAIVAVVAFASAVVVVASARTTANGLPSYTDGWQKWPRINKQAVPRHRAALERALRGEERLREQAQSRLEVSERHGDREDDRQARDEVRGPVRDDAQARTGAGGSSSTNGRARSRATRCSRRARSARAAT